MFLQNDFLTNWLVFGQRLNISINSHVKPSHFPLVFYKLDLQQIHVLDILSCNQPVVQTAWDCSRVLCTGLWRSHFHLQISVHVCPVPKVGWSQVLGLGRLKYLIVLLCNLYCWQEATVRTEYRETRWFPIGKGVRQRCILSPYLFNLYTEHIIQKTGLDWNEGRVKIGERNII